MPGGDGGCRIAAEQHELAPAPEQGFDAGARQVDDLRRRAIAVRHVGVIAQVEEFIVGKAIDERAKHRQSAQSGIEDADHARV